MNLAPNNYLALVPESLAVNLCGFRDAPPLVAVRQLYLNKLRGTIPVQDWVKRIYLLAYIEGKTCGLTVDWVMSEIDKRGIITVAFRSTHPHANSLVKSLAEHDFRVTRYEGYLLASRSIVDWVIDEIDTHGINKITFQSTHPYADSIVKLLAERDFQVTRYEDYLLPIRSIQEK